MPDISDRPRPLLLVVATVHLDSQWRWTIQETIREFIPRTLHENFELFESHPSYQLSFEGAFRYMLAREYYPEEFEELRHWVREGRWHPVGAMLDAPDVNIASPESLIRHILYGNGFFERELGRASQDVFLPDCFGFGHALPSIAAHCNLRSFSTSKLIKWKAPDSIPFEIARWRGSDGAEVVAAIQPGGYGEGIEEDLATSEEWIDRLGPEAPVRVGMRYVGTGDRGGSPDAGSLDRLEAATGSDGPVTVLCRAADSLVAELTEQELAELPVFNDELLLPTHGTGCWTAQAALKRWNRRNEQLADAAERAALLADWVAGIDYPQDRLTSGWIRFLWHQMHDDLTGTSIPVAYRFTWNDEAVAANLFAGVLTDSIDALAAAMDTSSNGLPLVVFNPSGHPREDVVEVVLAVDDLPAPSVRVLDPHGDPVPTQTRPLADDRVSLVFLASVGPVSVSSFEVVEARDEPRASVSEHPTASVEGRLENHRYRVSIDTAGDVASVWDKTLGRELLQRPIRLELLRNRSMRWPAWEIRPETLLAAPSTVNVGGPAKVRVIENGPARATLEIERATLGSVYRQRIRLAAGTAGERLEIRTDIDWSTRGRLLKVSFPLVASSPEATYDIGVGTIRRGNNRPERYEVPAQMWADLTDTSGEFGTAILNDSCYGWDKPGDNALRLSLLHSPFSWRKYPHQRTQDHGRHRSRIALCGHSGDAERPRVVQHAEALNQPLRAFVVEASSGDLGRSYSALGLSHPGVGIRALKKSEDGSGWIVRAQETGGRGQEAVRLTAAGGLRSADHVDGRETSHRAATVESGAVVFDLRPAGLETLLLRPADRAELAPTPKLLHLELPWDQRATSFDAETPVVDFDGRGHSVPAELWPSDKLVMGPVEFRVGPAEGSNALRCKGQTLEVPAGYRRLWLLAASIGGRQEVRLLLQDVPHRLEVADWTGWIAERPRRRWLGLRPPLPGSLRRDEIAWMATHRHLRNRNEPYVFCYLYRYALEIDPAGGLLHLPSNEAVRIFAMTLSESGGYRARPGHPLYGEV